MTDSSKSLRRADVSFVTHRDALHVNGNSNLDFSSEEHFRLDLCKQREPRCIRRRGDTLGPCVICQSGVYMIYAHKSVIM